MTIQAVNTTEAPAPVGPYNQAVIAGEWMYCSGQIALEPVSGKMIEKGNIEQETHQVLSNLKGVLKAAGLNPSHVIRTTIFLVDLKDFAKVNTIYSDFFKDGIYPARACVEVKSLPKGANVEIDCIAFLGNEK